MESKRFDTVIELLDSAFTQYRDLPAYTCMGHTLTYHDIDQLSQRFASYLQHHTSLKPGDRIAIQLPNILQYPVVLYGAIRAGLVVVNTNPLYTSRELKHQLTDSGAKALVTFANVADKAAEIIGQTDVEQVIMTELGDLFPWFKRQAVNFVVKHVKKMVPQYDIGPYVSLLDALNQGDQPFTPANAERDTVLVLQYTGGTTGTAKGAMLSHYNLCANVEQILNHMTQLFQEASDEVVAALPLYHIFAFNIHALCAFSRGAHNILIPNPRDIPAFVKTIKGRQISAFVAVNTLYNALARDKEFTKLDFSALKTSAAGGTAVTEEVIRLWQKVTGCPICEGYGLTETSPVLVANPNGAIQPGTIGTAVKDTGVIIVDDEGNEMPDEEPGELCARGPQIMLGYWKNPEATADVLSEDGWFRTGDIAVKRQDGYYKIVDRKKDMILVSGFNVYPNEVEDAVSSHPSVIECAVIGVPSESTGEAVKLYVVTDDKNLDKEALMTHCRKTLAAYKIPRQVEFRESLPKSNVGKILRKDLRKELEEREAIA